MTIVKLPGQNTISLKIGHTTDLKVPDENKYSLDISIDDFTTIRELSAVLIV